MAPARRRPEAFHLVVLAGLLFAGAIVWADVTGPQWQEQRAREAGLASARLQIRQMSCAACRAAILDALHHTDGVREVTPERSGATIAFDPKRVAPEELVRIVRSTGYDAALRPPGG
jgi:copper chaperone CopZ